MVDEAEHMQATLERGNLKDCLVQSDAIPKGNGGCRDVFAKFYFGSSRRTEEPAFPCSEDGSLGERDSAKFARLDLDEIAKEEPRVDSRPSVYTLTFYSCEEEKQDRAESDN